MKRITTQASIFSMLSILFSASLVAGVPDWTHQEQSTWGALDDTTQTVTPLMYPYAECTIGSHQSPVDLSSRTHEKPADSLRIDYERDTSPDFFNSGHARASQLTAYLSGQAFCQQGCLSVNPIPFSCACGACHWNKNFPRRITFCAYSCRWKNGGIERIAGRARRHRKSRISENFG